MENLCKSTQPSSRQGRAARVGRSYTAGDRRGGWLDGYDKHVLGSGRRIEGGVNF